MIRDDLRERLARAQFDAEEWDQHGIPYEWESLPEGNRQHRLKWAETLLNNRSLVVLRREDIEHCEQLPGVHSSPHKRCILR